MIPQSPFHAHLPFEQQCTAHNKRHKHAGATCTGFQLEVCAEVRRNIPNMEDFITRALFKKIWTLKRSVVMSSSVRGKDPGHLLPY